MSRPAGLRPDGPGDRHGRTSGRDRSIPPDPPDPEPDDLGRQDPPRPPDRGALSVHSAVTSPRSRLAGAEVLPRGFFARPALQVAPDLLGCVITHDTDEGLVAVVLAEVEAYAGEADPASPAFHGRTARNARMYGPPGHAYVYFTYGMPFSLNLVSQPERHASAGLPRARPVS